MSLSVSLLSSLDGRQKKDSKNGRISSYLLRQKITNMVATELRKWIVNDKLTWPTGLISPWKYSSRCNGLSVLAFDHKSSFISCGTSNNPPAKGARGQSHDILHRQECDSEDQGYALSEVLEISYSGAATFILIPRGRSYPVFLLTLHRPGKRGDGPMSLAAEATFSMLGLLGCPSGMTKPRNAAHDPGLWHFIPPFHSTRDTDRDVS
ncbi:hypothetical protein B0T09DRAFT_52997 [Sordaria sp. MPI-SDFR-AT-0083]|nr:hypothetical protein B0T09DRAFT_52997 [Sordaria sp. MPI-SDFR-AT-0083]